MSIIHNFHAISTGKSIYGIMFVIQGDLQCEKVNSKVKFRPIQILFSINTKSSKCDAYFYVILNKESICDDSFNDSMDIFKIKK